MTPETLKEALEIARYLVCHDELAHTEPPLLLLSHAYLELNEAHGRLKEESDRLKREQEIKLPKHLCGLSLEHNEHKNYYDTAQQWLKEQAQNGESPNHYFKDTEAYIKAITTDEVWVLQWYPNTPIGFIRVMAPTLEELLELANEM